MFGIDKLARRLDAAMREISERLTALERMASAMPTRQDLDALKASLKEAIAAEAQQVNGDIQKLRDALAQGNPITDDDLRDLQQSIDAVKNIDPDVTTNP